MAEGRQSAQFRRIRKDRPATHTPIPENEIRITNNDFVTQYIQYALDRLDTKNEKHFDEVVLQGMGQAIAKTVQVAETVKRRVKGLHQITEISSTKITDYYEPTVVGMEPKGFERTISVIQIRLSLKPLDKAHYGYQAPLPDEEVKEPRPVVPRGAARGGAAASAPAGSSTAAATTGAPAERPFRGRGGRRGGRGGYGRRGGYYGGGYGPSSYQGGYGGGYDGYYGGSSGGYYGPRGGAAGGRGRGGRGGGLGGARRGRGRF